MTVTAEVDGRKKVFIDGEWRDLIEPNVGCDHCSATRIGAQLFHEPNCNALKKAGPGKEVESPECSGCRSVVIDGKLVHEPGCPWLDAPVGGGLGIIHASGLTHSTKKLSSGLTKAKKVLEKEEPEPPKGYGELKVGMEGMLNGVPVRIRKITKKDIVLRPTNKAIKDEHGLMVSFKEKK